MYKHLTRRKLVVRDFEDAVKRVIDLLRESDDTEEGKTRAFIVRGWQANGLGGCAVFRAIAKLLKSTICNDSDMRKHFGKIVHVDCSVWKNRRTMQRAIAEELNLLHVMPIFDKKDEDDDFRGMEDFFRGEISSIGCVINESLRNEKFLMIFHYGGPLGDINLAACGIPVFGNGKLLCTDGRFQPAKEQTISTNFLDSYIFTEFSDHVAMNLWHALHEEAMGVIGDIGMEGINPAIVLECFLYSLFLAKQLPENSIGVDNGWATHATNYWICDGILGEDRAWEIGNKLYRVMPWLGYSSYGTRHLLNRLLGKQQETSWMVQNCQNICWWYPITSNKVGAKDICNVPDCASSYFVTFKGPDPVHVQNDLFQLASNLRVLKLCNCSFDFASPPFQSCHNLRFLWLEHCTNTGKEQSGALIFPNLLVFDLRFTYYVLLPQMVEVMTNLRELNTKGVPWKTMSHVWKKLQKLHKLQVTESSDVVTVDSCSSIDMMNLKLLDFSGNTRMESLPILSSARSLKMLILDGCSSLENVVLAMERAPPLLETFSFDGIAPTKNVQVTKISLQGCGRLQNIYLCALPNLEELDLSGTAIRRLNLNARHVPKLKKLFLLGCQQLHSLVWFSLSKLEVLHVDTQGEKRSMVCCGEQRSFGFHAFITFTDGRFTWSSTQGLNDRMSYGPSKVYLLISCMSHSQANINKSIDEIGSNQEGLVPISPMLPYNNIILTEDVTCLSLVWTHRQLQTLDVHIEIGEGSNNLERMQDNEYFVRFVGHVQSLHVHDNSSIIAISPTDEGNWNNLEWCHVERCPKLHSLFFCRDGPNSFARMEIFSASDLLVAHCIWGRGINIQSSTECFQQLQHIYLYNCPRLVFVLPISFTLPNLETLQIAYCSSLRHVFPLDDKYPPAIASGVTFKNLNHIKLYHLHNLEQICEARLTAPALQTVSLRDCWGLRRLPAVARKGPKPVVDCEKDWWNRLEWDGLDAGHDPSLFETRHSAYYKKTLPRVSVLR